MTERYISVTDDEYVYFLDTESEDYKTLEDFEKKEFEKAKKDNIDIEEYEDAILQSASDKYWDYVYEHYIEADVVCDRLNEQDKQIKELEKENDELKKKILEEIDLEVAYVNETYSDGRMSKEQHNGAIISLRQLREKFE